MNTLDDREPLVGAAGSVPPMPTYDEIKAKDEPEDAGSVLILGSTPPALKSFVTLNKLRRENALAGTGLL